MTTTDAVMLEDVVELALPMDTKEPVMGPGGVLRPVGRGRAMLLVLPLAPPPPPPTPPPPELAPFPLPLGLLNCIRIWMSFISSSCPPKSEFPL